VSGAVVDTSVWIDFFAGRPCEQLELALRQGSVVLPPVVAAELISGAHLTSQRQKLIEFLSELLWHETPPEY
jgi:predicted nucleic acid-binding protein